MKLLEQIKDGFIFRTQIEPMKHYGRKKAHGFQIVVRKIVERDGYAMDHGPVRFLMEKHFDRPLVVGSAAYQYEMQQYVKRVESCAVKLASK